MTHHPRDDEREKEREKKMAIPTTYERVFEMHRTHL
jgi:hypothetical protein